MSSKFNNRNNQNQQQNQNQDQQQNQQQNQKQNKKNNNFNNQKTTKTIFKKKIRHCGKFAMPCFFVFIFSEFQGLRL